MNRAERRRTFRITSKPAREPDPTFKPPSPSMWFQDGRDSTWLLNCLEDARIQMEIEKQLSGDTHVDTNMNIYGWNVMLSEFDEIKTFNACLPADMKQLVVPSVEELYKEFVRPPNKKPW